MDEFQFYSIKLLYSLNSFTDRVITNFSASDDFKKKFLAFGFKVFFLWLILYLVFYF
jgi:hypothetical protein